MGSTNAKHRNISEVKGLIELDELYQSNFTDQSLENIEECLVESDFFKIYLIILETNPELVNPGSLMYLSLISQHFVELIREKKPEEALNVALSYLSDYRASFLTVKRSQKEFIDVQISEMLGLLCYENPENSELAFLLNNTQRAYITQQVKSLIGNDGCKCCSFWKCFKT